MPSTTLTHRNSNLGPYTTRFCDRGSVQIKSSDQYQLWSYSVFHPIAEELKGSALWIEGRGLDYVTRPLLDAFRAHGNGKFEHGLSNLSVYFWRWGTWKVFDAHPEHPPGIIALITTAAYLRGPVGFQKSA